MAEGNDGMIEGFLCPMCISKGDFGTAIKLMTHFQEEHSGEQDLLRSFKELFGKAKKKILKQDDFADYNFTSRLQSPTGNVEWEDQELGTTMSHFSSFEKIRAARLQRFSIPVNQLLIRLDKLLEGMPRDPAKKKAHEQNKVPWLDGSAVPRCPSCTRSFHLARRQHHCRLCGAILCDECSSFLPLQAGYKLLDKPQPQDLEGTDLTLRICNICLELLESRQQQKDMITSKPIISQFYERLLDHRKQADQDLDMYFKMANSLREGESTYNMNDAQTLRMKIIRLAENIDSLSGKIAVLGTKDTENPPQGQALALQKAIRSAATGYLRTKLLTLPTLPTEEELAKIRETKRQEVMARLQEEKLREAQFNQVVNQSSPHHRRSVSGDSNIDKSFSVGEGWVPSEKMQNFRTDDPLIQQINIIQNYIKEARKAHRYDEVASLEANLSELRQEWWRNLQEQELRKQAEESGTGSVTSDEVEQTSS
ncbi:rabenosyn-5 [Macrosteles quadrilineatus]|uniref:rabenosyn-5 n=1 Tax=Macrosteles quadrilineatus TaxID=74068 RepID=UPI0023E10388|nr:rabenosyn-5 [Macrosteles quadrilineatus]XP_054273923.1 rabenosyn-5 [Macrosteles quadrilineatus]XP_054273924.1 rabenosyn-5 [Macrosteles quadrilineatus]